ncbi:MAG: DUF4339 domain-containing protein [Bacteroidetes bacterium]|nr:DUF4339 domain-containing protein [Bacteroidota bacterium]
MTEYYILRGENKEGPFSLEALKNQKIFTDTLIGMPGWENWKPAVDVPELKDLISKDLPPVPTTKSNKEISETPPTYAGSMGTSVNLEDELVPSQTKYDYSQVEDIAGVDYQKAMYATGAYIAINIFFKDIAVLNFAGILISTTLVVFVWIYFKKYFDAMKDNSTSKLVTWIIGAYILFGVVNLFSNSFMSIYSIPDTGEDELARSSGFIYIGIIAAMLVVFISGIRLIGAGSRHQLPLKRIAVSSMILIPVYMVVSLLENMPLLDEIAQMFGDDQFETGPVFNILVMLPFFFLLQHFYRADKYDATPG